MLNFKTLFRSINKFLIIPQFNTATSKFPSYREVPIEKNHIETNFMRSSGPGGQSVNTTNSKA